MKSMVNSGNRVSHTIGRLPTTVEIYHRYKMPTCYLSYYVHTPLGVIDSIVSLFIREITILSHYDIVHSDVCLKIPELNEHEQ